MKRSARALRRRLPPGPTASIPGCRTPCPTPVNSRRTVASWSAAWAARPRAFREKPRIALTGRKKFIQLSTATGRPRMKSLCCSTLPLPTAKRSGSRYARPRAPFPAIRQRSSFSATAGKITARTSWDLPSGSPTPAPRRPCPIWTMPCRAGTPSRTPSARPAARPCPSEPNTTLRSRLRTSPFTTAIFPA